MKDRAEIVVVGSGIAGSSIAWHLTKLGKRDVMVLDQGPLIGGTTSHAPGLVGQLRSSVSLTKMLVHSVSVYRDLRLDGQPGYFEVGSLRLASSPERYDEIRRQCAFAEGVGLAARLVSPAEAHDLFPLMDLAGVKAALYLPTDGAARALILAGALAAGAAAGGATFHPHVRIEGFDIAGGRIQALLTSAGRIAAETVILATGIWTPHIARLAGVDIPLVPMQHQYALTGPVPGLTGAVPIANMRDPDLLVYGRQDGERLVVGGYERDPAPFPVADIPSHERQADPTVHPFDEARFAPLWAGLTRRIPLLRDVPPERRVNGLEAFTPDGEFILGETPEVAGLWVACGFCAHGVSGAGGVGKVIAEWLVEGEPSVDTWHMDVRRFARHTRSRNYVLRRTSEVYGKYYDIFYPGEERASARNLRLSPLYARLSDLGAVWGEKAGWERPNYYRPNEALVNGHAWPAPRGWASRNWSPAVGAEHTAARERVALFDETSFSKLEVAGPAALGFLQGLTGNQQDQPVGTVSYTQLLNTRGGIECDLTITRLGADRFRLVTGTAFGQHDLAWLRRFLPADGSVTLRDVTSETCCIGVWGPRARTLMARVSEDDFSHEGFPYMTAKQVVVGVVPVLALRVTFVGELGWELYAPMEYGQTLWDTLWEAGIDLGATAAGYWAIDSLRLEKGYRYWSADIHSEYNPYEAGLGFAVKLGKGNFLGRDALIAIKERGVNRKLCCLTLADPTAIVLGGEPFYAGGEPVGRVTSGGYGYTVRQSIAYGYLPVDLAVPGTELEVAFFGERVAATVVQEPLYDPTGRKIKQ
jgi:4-methylaminobutanoate oxidase (formaldehyde-forming)